MNKDVLRLGAIAAAAIIAVIAIAMIYRSGQEADETAQLAALDATVFIRDHSPTLGPADARVTVVEFLDPECESCRVMHPIMKRLINEYGNRIRYVVRYMPLHGNSVYAAGALEAAGAQGRYWDMLETLFLYQPEWGNHHQPRPELIPGYARELGLDIAAFDAFLADGAYKTRVEIDRSDGQTLGVRGTPTFFVNERPLPQLGYDPLKAMIEAGLRAP